MTAIAPGPRQRYPAQHLFVMRRDPLAFLTGLARRYGDGVHFRLAAQHVTLLSDPEHVRDVLVTRQRTFVKSRALDRARLLLGEGLLTANGEHHLRQRRLAQPAFHRQRMAGYASTMIEEGLKIRETWRDGAELDVSREMMRVTLAIAGRTMFSTDVSGEAEEIGAALTNALELFDIAVLPFAEVFVKLPLPRSRRFNRARARLDQTIHRIIAERRRDGRDRGDLLSMLMLARDEEGDGTGMSDAQLRDEALTIFLAGHETTANALAWTWYLLAQNPQAESRLHAELEAVLGMEAPEAEDFPALDYTRRVLAESMRLYPPAWVLGRRPLVDFEIGGHLVRAGSIVLMSQWVVHRDPRWWADPLRFDPDRWGGPAERERPRFAYFPFGGGTRQCIGEHFAWMEGVLLLATIAQRWRFRLAPGAVPTTQPLITLRARGMRMVAERR